MGTVADIFKGLTEPVSRAFEARENRKIKERELQDAAHARSIEAVKNTENLEHALSLAQISISSWKDEWFTIVFSLPLVLGFYPPAVPILQAGFQALEGMPLWYKTYLGAAVTAAFGLQTVDRCWKWWNSP